MMVPITNLNDKIKVNKVLRIAFIFLIICMCACGGKSDTISSSSSSVYTGGGYCSTSTKSFSGCCSSHGGIQPAYNKYDDCLSDEYLFTSDSRLICNDGTVSPTCTY